MNNTYVCLSFMHASYIKLINNYEVLFVIIAELTPKLQQPHRVTASRLVFISFTDSSTRMLQ